MGRGGCGCFLGAGAGTARSLHCGAGASMDGMDVWVSTLAQLMAKRKPEDTWELVLEENLASGHLDSGSYEYQLRGLSRFGGGEGSPASFRKGRGLKAAGPRALGWPRVLSQAGCDLASEGWAQGHMSGLVLSPNRWVGWVLVLPSGKWGTMPAQSVSVATSDPAWQEGTPGAQWVPCPDGGQWDDAAAQARLCLLPRPLLVSMAALTGAGDGQGRGHRPAPQ